MKGTIKFTLLCLILVFGLMACSPAATDLVCDDSLGCVEVGPGESVNIAYMLTISGPTAFLGEDSRGGIEIAIADYGDLLGHSINLIGEDSMCSAEGGQAAAQRVAANDTILGAIGTSCSSAGEAALPIISGANMVMVSPSNTAPTLTALPEDGGTWQAGYYRTAHNDEFQGRVAAEYAYNELGARTAATIHDGSPYADGLQRVFVNTFLELGGTVPFQGSVNEGDTDMRPILTNIAAEAPDVIYFPIFEPEGNFIADQSREISGLENTILMGADGLLSESFPRNTGPAAVGMYLSGPYIEGNTYQDFLGKWEEAIGGTPPSGFHAHAYDATMLLLNAIESVAQQADDGTLLIGRQALRDALSATSNHSGLTGNLTCGPTGDCATGEALGIYVISEAEVAGENWPPEAVWTP